MPCPHICKKLHLGILGRLTGTQMRFISSANWVIYGSGIKCNIVFYMNKYQAGQPSITQPSCQLWQLIINWLDMVGEPGRLYLRGRGCGVQEEKISTRQRLLSNFNSSADEMRWEEQEMKTLAQTLEGRHKGGYEAVTNTKWKWSCSRFECDWNYPLLNSSLEMNTASQHMQITKAFYY